MQFRFQIREVEMAKNNIMNDLQNIQPDIDIIDKMLSKARKAQKEYEEMGSQALFDQATQAVAWSLMEPKRNKLLSEMAVKETNLGRIEDKIKKNHNKTLGLMRDLKDQKTFGLISNDTAKGLTEYFRPKGVVAAIVPSTNPIATPVNNIINSLKTGNSIILAPSPKGAKPLQELLKIIHKELQKLNLPDNLVQMVTIPPTKQKTQHLMKQADFLIVTGSQSNVKLGYESGTPAIGVGVGNVVTIVDETADLRDAAQKISESKTFDNATSCSSENSIIVVEQVYDNLIDELQKVGGLVLNHSQAKDLEKIHWKDGKLNSTLIAQNIDKVLSSLSIEQDTSKNIKFLIVPCKGVGPSYPISGEKMALFLSIYRENNFYDASRKAIEIQNYQGSGHSLGLHSKLDDRLDYLAMKAKSCRIIVNQAHCFATGGFFNNGLPFSLSMGCGSWGGNSIDDNLSWKHFVNRVRVVRLIPSNKPELEDIFADYWKVYGN